MLTLDEIGPNGITIRQEITNIAQKYGLWQWRCKVTNFYSLLQKIKQRPPLYLGSYSITSLHSFLSGYILARLELDVPQTEEERQFDTFQSWIENKFNMKSTHSWAKIILFHSMDERDALDHFFKLFEEFARELKNSSRRQLREATSA